MMVKCAQSFLVVLVVSVGFSFLAPVHASKLVVMESKAASVKVGQTLDGAAPIVLKAGEGLSLISQDGKIIKLSGPYSGPPITRGAVAASDSKQALAAMLSSRDARTSSVGVFRSVKPAAKPASPWWVDVSSAASSRCAQTGQAVYLWRQDARRSEPVSVLGDKLTWLADTQWKEGEHGLSVMPPKTNLSQAVAMTVRLGEGNSEFSMSWIPAEINDPVVLIAWMREKGCQSQADILLNQATSGGAQRN